MSGVGFVVTEAFWLRWEKEARSDMVRQVNAEARKVAKAQGEDVASESCAGATLANGTPLLQTRHSKKLKHVCRQLKNRRS